MPSTKTKSRVVQTLLYLLEMTDAEHDVSSKDIMRALTEQGLPTVDNRTVEQDVDMLIAAGYDIDKHHRNGVPPRYKLIGRDFDTVELKMLIDAVAASRFIQLDRSRHLIQSLARLAGPGDRASLASAADSLQSIKQAVGGTMYVADALYRAIVSRKKVTYQMTDLRVPDKQPVLHRDGHVYKVSPYAMIWSNDRYYLLAHEEKRGIILTPRVDHITNVTILDEPIRPAPEGFDIGYYYSSSYKMYDGPEEEITLLCRNRLIGKMVDRFGAGFECIPVSDDIFQATVTASIGPTFFGWLLQYAGQMQLIGPESVVKQYKRQRRIAGLTNLSREAAEHPIQYPPEEEPGDEASELDTEETAIPEDEATAAEAECGESSPCEIQPREDEPV